jgi:hypothetical protein
VFNHGDIRRIDRYLCGSIISRSVIKDKGTIARILQAERTGKRFDLMSVSFDFTPYDKKALHLRVFIAIVDDKKKI